MYDHLGLIKRSDDSGRLISKEVPRVAVGKKKYLGEMLVQAGLITGEQLSEALQKQDREQYNGEKGLLGNILVGLHYCTEDDIARVVAEQNGIRFLSLEEYRPDASAGTLIDAEMARRYQALPVGFEEGRLLVAMRNPSDIIAIDDLRILTGYDIIPVACGEGELQAAIERFASTETAEVSQEAEQEVSFSPAETEETEGEAGRPAVQLANLILNRGVRAGASDIHIEPLEKALRIRFRIDGVLHEVMRPPRRLHPPLISRLKVMANMDIAEHRIPQDGRITTRIDDRVFDIRVACLPTAYGEKITMRLLERSGKIITLEQLGFPSGELEKYRRVMHFPYGLILVTGPTGSGKSTTLYATLEAINSVEKHIITIEDPIEYRLEGVNQMQVNNKAGFTFATGLRAILRNDPDIIMVGEVRDRETARIAFESALTGHLVFATLHTNDAAGSVTRLVDMEIEPFLIASSLAAVVAQRLARVLCPHCRQPYQIDGRKLLAAVPDFPVEPGEERLTLYKPGGCMRCNQTGYRGRIGVFELLLIDEKIQKLILERASAGEIKRAAINNGMVTLRRDGLLKVKQGITSLEELVRVIV